MMHFTNYIRRRRIEKEYTQDYMALRLDMSISAYSKLERGQTDPPLSRIIKIAEILEFDLTDFFVWRQQDIASSQLNESSEVSNYKFVTKRELSEVLLLLEEFDQRLLRLEGK